MRKLLFLAFASVFLVSLAKSPITVKFKEFSDNPEVTGLLGVLDAYQITTTLYADSLDAKYYAIWMVICKDNETQRKLMGYYPVNPDSTEITVTSIPKDSLNVIIHAGRIHGISRNSINIPTGGYLLIGCDYDWKFSENDTIPLMGYSSGIPSKFKLGNGEVVDAFDICGLRFSKIHPSKWKEKYNLPDYLYIEAIPVKEMNFFNN